MRRALLPPCLFLFLQACRSFPGETVVLIHTSGGEEVGASTTHGIVFPGRYASEGTARVAVWFGDGAAVETGEIEKIVPGLCTVPLEIATPQVEIAVDPPQPGESVLLAGRRDGSLWTAGTRVASATPGEPALLDPVGGIPASGALAFREEEERWRFLGFVAPSPSGALPLAGPELTWRFLFRPRPLGPPPFPPKRPDVR